MNKLRNRMMAVLIAAGMTILLGAGCSGENDDRAPSVQPTSEDRDDIAEDFGTALASDEEGMLRMWRGEGGGFNVSEREGERALDDTLVVQRNGFTFVKIRNFYDVNDVWSEFYIPGVTARMEQTLSVEGTRESNSGNRSVTVAHYDTIEVNGLLPIFDVWTVNGQGERNTEGEFRSRFRQNVRTFESHYVWSVTDLQWHTNQLAYPYPLDGELAVTGVWINTHTNPGRDVERSVHFSFVIYFDGTRYAQLVFAGGGSYWIDLENGWCSHLRPGGNG